MHPAASFVLETAFSDHQPLHHLPLQPPLDLNFDIKALLSSATALGSATERRSGTQRAIRRLLKPSALTSSCEIPIWQQLVDGKEWLQCPPATCVKLETDPGAAPDSKLYRRVVLQPGSIGSAQLPLAMKSEPYCAPAQAADIAMLSNRVHDSLPEWDISNMVQVWNPALASKYADYRHRLASRGNGDPNERIMFHYAPSPEVIAKIWEQGEGHDPRLSNWAEVGKGAYFSTHPIYGYAYKNSLWPSPPGFAVGAEPPVGETMQVFASLVCLGSVADVGPGCETCASPAWNAWKREPPVMPKPTRPPAMTLPASAAEKQHVLDLFQNKEPRYDSVTSSEGDLGTHPASTNKDASGRRICDVMHPRLRARAKEWGQQCVLFDTAASYPMFIVTLTKARDSPVGAQQLIDAGCDANRIKSLGFNASDVKAAGQSVHEMRDGGWALSELKDAGFDAVLLLGGGYSAPDLRSAGFTAAQMKDAGCSCLQLKDAGFSASELKACSFDLASLIAAGHNASQLKSADFTASDLKTLGQSVQEMWDSGWVLSELKDAGFDVGLLYPLLSPETASPHDLAAAKQYYSSVEFGLQLCREFAAENAANDRDGQVVVGGETFLPLPGCYAEASGRVLSAALGNACEMLERIVACNTRLKSSDCQPKWLRHTALLRFDLPLHRLTTHYVVSKKWFPRFFSLRGSRLYYSDGKNRHPDTAEGTLAFLRPNPAPDGRYCVDVQGMRAAVASASLCNAAS
jgi:hypothetical protein